MGEQSGQPQRKSTSGWLIAVVGLLIAIVLGWAMMAIASKKLESANKVRSDSEGRLMIAVDFAAQEAMKSGQDAQVAINRSNWGQAGGALARVNDLVTLMEQVAPEDKRSAVSDVRNSLSDAQKAVGSQSQDAVQAINTLITKLDGLREKKQGQ